MYSRNEWDPLQEVIVGIANDATIPPLDKSLRTVNYADVKDESTIPQGRYPQQVIDEANEDLEGLCAALRAEGVVVKRPDVNIKPNYYNYCPRDTMLVHDKLVLAAPMSLRARATEYKAMKQHFDNIHVCEINRKDDLYNENCLGDPDILALTNEEPCFDAANIIRANDDLIYLVSNSGNRAGAEYLRRMHGKKIHTIEGVYSYMHIDSTITLLREGLMLLNPSRIKRIEQLPKVLQSWDYIMSPEPVDIGHYPGYCNSSKWININLVSVNPNLVILDKHQDDLRKELEKHKIESIMLQMRHQRTLGGGFHCVTLDVKRKHE